MKITTAHKSSKKKEDATEQLGLTNTPNNPLGSDLVPEVLPHQVMYDPSAKPMERVLICQESNDNDSVSNDNFFLLMMRMTKKKLTAKPPPPFKS
eukprot:jgi/Psemu1/21880/gm1.21880_g